MEHNPFMHLGLGDLEARVLATVVAEEEVTAATLSTATGAGAPAISVAVQSLWRRGLVTRVPGRRPSVIFLAAGAIEAVGRLVAAVEEQETVRREHIGQAVTLLTGAAARRVERGRPCYELEPPRGNDGQWALRQARTTHDQVLSGSDALQGTAPRSLRCPARLLVTGRDIDLEEIAGRQRPGSEVRATEESLPAVWLLDGERMGTTASTTQGIVRVWTRDQSHVRAAAEWFDLRWGKAGRGVVTPYPPVLPEGPLDVDEWDPAEMPPAVSG